MNEDINEQHSACCTCVTKPSWAEPSCLCVRHLLPFERFDLHQQDKLLHIPRCRLNAHCSACMRDDEVCAPGKPHSAQPYNYKYVSLQAASSIFDYSIQRAQRSALPAPYFVRLPAQHANARTSQTPAVGRSIAVPSAVPPILHHCHEVPR